MNLSFFSDLFSEIINIIILVKTYRPNALRGRRHKDQAVKQTVPWCMWTRKIHVLCMS